MEPYDRSAPPEIDVTQNLSLILLKRACSVNTYDHRSAKTGHPVRNYEVSIVFTIPGTKMRLVDPVENFVMCLVSFGVTVCLVTALASMMFEK